MPKLTESDLNLVERAGVLREPADMAVIRERTGESTDTLAFIREVGRLRDLVGALADRVVELGS